MTENKKEVQKGKVLIPVEDLVWAANVAYPIEVALHRAVAIHNHFAQRGVHVSLEEIFHNVSEVVLLHIRRALEEEKKKTIKLPEKKQEGKPDYFG